VVGPFVLPDARPSSKQKAPRGKETRPSKFVLRKQQNEVLPAVKPLCSLDPLAYDRSSIALVFPISTPTKGVDFSQQLAQSARACFGEQAFRFALCYGWRDFVDKNEIGSDRVFEDLNLPNCESK
jgi:hypothetical protein